MSIRTRRQRVACAQRFCAWSVTLYLYVARTRTRLGYAYWGAASLAQTASLRGGLSVFLFAVVIMLVIGAIMLFVLPTAPTP